MQNKAQKLYRETPQTVIPFPENLLPGSMDDASLVRALVSDAIKLSGKSREQIAEQMSYLTGKEITARMLNCCTAESKELHRWPAEWDRAFCAATNDYRLVRERAQLSGFIVLEKEEAELLELGRSYRAMKLATQTVHEIEHSLSAKGK